MEGCVDIGGLLHAEMLYLPACSYRISSYPAWRKATLHHYTLLQYIHLCV